MQNVDVLADARTEDLAFLASIAEEVEYPAGTVLFTEGEPADGLYVIVRGEVELRRDGETLVTMGDNDVLGAWTLFEPEPRVATARTTKETLVLRVDREDFYDLLLDYPELGQSILKALVRRLRRVLAESRP